MTDRTPEQIIADIGLGHGQRMGHDRARWLLERLAEHGNKVVKAHEYEAAQEAAAQCWDARDRDAAKLARLTKALQAAHDALLKTAQWLSEYAEHQGTAAGVMSDAELARKALAGQPKDEIGIICDSGGGSHLLAKITESARSKAVKEAADIVRANSGDWGPDLVRKIEALAGQPAPDLKRFGYAPGTYECICSNCGKHHVADKRARSCLECAEKALAGQPAPPPKPLREIRRIAEADDGALEGDL